MTQDQPNPTITTAGRTQIDELFKLSGILDGKLSHTPFLAFLATEQGVEVRIFDRARDLVAECPPKTPVMVQWRGQWSSDFFQMTAADVAHALAARLAR